MGELVVFPVERTRPGGEVIEPITKAALAERWRVSPRWIELRMKDEHNPLPHLKDPYSRFVRFPVADCERWRMNRMRRTA